MKPHGHSDSTIFLGRVMSRLWMRPHNLNQIEIGAIWRLSPNRVCELIAIARYFSGKKAA